MQPRKFASHLAKPQEGSARQDRDSNQNHKNRDGNIEHALRSPFCSRKIPTTHVQRNPSEALIVRPKLEPEIRASIRAINMQRWDDSDKCCKTILSRRRRRETPVQAGSHISIFVGN
jgi:hypothetical protein